MQTYKYHFPMSGTFESPKETREYTEYLEHNLSVGKNNLESYDMFPAGSTILDHVSFTVDKSNGTISGIDLYTRTELLDGNDFRLERCMTENIQTTDRNFYNTWNLQGKASITGPMEDLNKDSNAEAKWEDNVTEDFSKAVNQMSAQTLGAVLE